MEMGARGKTCGAHITNDLSLFGPDSNSDIFFDLRKVSVIALISVWMFYDHKLAIASFDSGENDCSTPYCRNRRSCRGGIIEAMMGPVSFQYGMKPSIGKGVLGAPGLDGAGKMLCSLCLTSAAQV